MESTIDRARRWYAEELKYTAPIRSPALFEAFANVPREHFLGPGPWELQTEAGTFQIPEGKPEQLYHNGVVALDRERAINNGEPKFWASVLDQLEIREGARILHVGAGTGYYTAILAATAGASGSITAIEIDGDLAAKAASNLNLWPQVTVHCTNGFTFDPGPVNAIVVSAGVSQISLTWLDALADGGQLLTPLTVTREWTSHSGKQHRNGGEGGMLWVRRTKGKFAARFLTKASFIHCTDGRSDDAEERLRRALLRLDIDQVRSLRRAPETPDNSCWLEGEGWYLSTVDP
jgi:protein-L-isoaspartate(D-aspartate) O-methyltransferase